MSSPLGTIANPPTLTLNNGVAIPQVGYGVFQIPPAQAQESVETAIGLGYRHIDTAAAYNNEQGVGAAVRASGVRREDLFVTTKLRNGEQGYESAPAAFRASLERLGLDYVDLYLIHWPSPARDAYVESWRALERLYADGLVRAIGVSNFLPHHLTRLISDTQVVPAVDQIEVHPRFQQREVGGLASERGIAIEAYSPLGQGAELSDPVIARIAEEHAATPAQVILRWHLDKGRIAIPKSATPSRMAENLGAVGIALTADDLKRIDALESGQRVGGNPDTFEISQIR